MNTKANKYPSKNYINFAEVRTRARLPIVKLIIFSVLIIAAAALFGKFAVADRFARVTTLEREVNELQVQADTIKTAVADYADVKQRYDIYCAEWLNEEEKECVSRTDMLSLVERVIVPKAEVTSLSAVGSTLSVNIVTESLEDTAGIVNALDNCEIVKGVELYTAVTPAEGENTAVHVSLIITMTSEGGAAE